MAETDRTSRFKARIEAELSDLLDWVEAPEIRGVAKERILQRQRQLEAAFLRILQGTFDVCCNCGERLLPAELDANPAAPLCSYCQEERSGISAK